MSKVEGKMHYKEWRKEQKSTFGKALEGYNFIVVGNLLELPAKAERKFRAILKESGCYTKVVNSKVAIKALHEKGIKNLDSQLKGPTLFILANDSPFKMYKELKKNASESFAKEGMIAPEDIYVKEGDTGIPPGPALTDFKMANIDTQIKNGKIYISHNTLVCKKGDKVNAKVATLLTKLNIKPMKIILDLRTVLDKTENIFYNKDVLDVNIEELIAKIKTAYMNSYYLALGNNYIAKETIKPLLTKGYKNSKALALASNFVTKDTAKDILTKAQRIANSLSSKTK